MKNTVIAQIIYSFKGESFSPSIILELDTFSKFSDNFSGLHSKIAKQNNIDTYSYAYEVMESSELVFHSPTGNVVDFVADGKCDLLAYQNYLKQAEMLIEIEQIANDVLEIADLHAQEQQGIKNALIKAYIAGNK